MTLFDPDALGAGRPPEPSCRVKLTVAYDGSRFHGIAAQPGVKTVGAALAGALARFLRHEVVLTCAGRTDTGVHAWGQVVSFDAHADGLDFEQLRRAVNRMVGPAIVVREAEEAAPGFDARRWARSRRYRYTVLNRPVPDPFTAHVSWHIEQPLDLRAMQAAADPLIGEHDFSSFCRRPPVEDYSMVRNVREAGWVDAGDGVLRFEIEANAFCHQMVRAIVGTLVDMGRGRKRAGDMLGILRGRDRALAGNLAPPAGLCLWEVRY